MSWYWPFGKKEDEKTPPFDTDGRCKHGASYQTDKTMRTCMDCGAEFPQEPIHVEDIIHEMENNMDAIRVVVWRRDKRKKNSGGWKTVMLSDCTASETISYINTCIRKGTRPVIEKKRGKR